MKKVYTKTFWNRCIVFDDEISYGVRHLASFLSLSLESCLCAAQAAGFRIGY